ncbi:MAG: 50S ribosomal protein L25/general stress protein Ctc [Alphaproteobacteria bacterium]|nr:50S ribosomal protein L25/general stress protein Ctc [Alphaproteobacteria bacterium]
MSKNYALKAEKRERAGKGVARSLRREGKSPAVIYGDKKEPVKISISANELNVQYNRGHMFTSLCDLNVDGDKHLVLARDIQLHPVTDIVEHVDFLRVNAKTQIVVDVPVHFINEDKCPSLDDKGTLNIVRHTVELRCSAMDIPEFIEANLEGKEHGDAVKISDATLPEGVKPVIEGRDFTLATLIAPKTAEQLEAELEVDTDDGIISDEEAAAAKESGEGAEGDEAKEKSED